MHFHSPVCDITLSKQRYTRYFIQPLEDRRLVNCGSANLRIGE